jgi:hypothetical protein
VERSLLGLQYTTNIVCLLQVVYTLVLLHHEAKMEARETEVKAAPVPTAKQQQTKTTLNPKKTAIAVPPTVAATPKAVASKPSAINLIELILDAPLPPRGFQEARDPDDPFDMLPPMPKELYFRGGSSRSAVYDARDGDKDARRLPSGNLRPVDSGGSLRAEQHHRSSSSALRRDTSSTSGWRKARATSQRSSSGGRSRDSSTSSASSSASSASHVSRIKTGATVPLGRSAKARGPLQAAASDARTRQQQPTDGTSSSTVRRPVPSGSSSDDNLL